MVTYERLKYNGADVVQVRSAQRDGTGKVIADTYYIKPSTGIPKTDLASAVQTSLGKADTALQSIVAGPGISVSSNTVRETYPVYYAKPNESTATATLTATISNFPSAYADGIMIALRMPFANSASTTLNVNSLGAKPVYYANTTTSASRLAANTVVMLVYETTTVSTGCWKALYSYDGNNTTSCRQQLLQTGNTDRPLLMSYAITSNTTTNIDNITYRSNSIYANPSTGKITATSGSVASGDAQLVTGGAVHTALQSYLPLSGGTLTGSLTLTGTNGITSNNIVFNDWKLGVARNASGKLYRYVGLDTNSTTGWLKTRAEADVITDLGIDLKAPLASPALTGTPTAPTATAGTNTTQIATTAFVKTAIDNLPEPMLFKGTLGTGGTITSLPTAAAGNEGYVYKVITAGTYASQAAKVGDLFICANTSTTSTPTYAWTYVPSGDEPSGTVTNVATGAELTGGPITTSGTISHSTSGVTAGTYQSVTVNTYGHVTAGSNPFSSTQVYIEEVD